MSTVGVRIVEELQKEVNDFLSQRRESFNALVEGIYKDTVLKALAEVKAVVKGEELTTGMKLLDPPSATRSAHNTDPRADVGGPGEMKGVRFSEKWKLSGSSREVCGVDQFDGLISLSKESSTPRSVKIALISDSGNVSWGDRVRSHSPTYEAKEMKEHKEEGAPISQTQKASMIPKPPPPPEPWPVEEMKEKKTEIEIETEIDESEQEDSMPDDTSEKTVKSSFNGKKIPVAVEKSKPRIWALEKAAEAKAVEEKRELERKKRKAQMLQWKKEQKKAGPPIKTAVKPDHKNCGVKRLSKVESSACKKQKLEATNKKDEKPKTSKQSLIAAEQTSGRQTPDVLRTTGLQTPTEIRCSPQYELTPIGLLHTDYDKRAYRKKKHVPSWANKNALETSMLQQRNQTAMLFSSPPETINLRQVFGTPDSMVVRNATARAYRYDHRSMSSLDWSESEEEGKTTSS